MTIRIPASLNWLVKKFQQTETELAQIEKELQPLLIKKSELLELSKSLSLVLKEHEISITSSEIPTKQKYIKRTSIKKGVITKKIYECLGTLDCSTIISLSEIVDYVIDNLNIKFYCQLEKTNFRGVIRNRMKSLTYEKKVILVQPGVAKKVDSLYKLPNRK
jgi:hypothetical protein